MFKAWSNIELWLKTRFTVQQKVKRNIINWCILPFAAPIAINNLCRIFSFPIGKPSLSGKRKYELWEIKNFLRWRKGEEIIDYHIGSFQHFHYWYNHIQETVGSFLHNNLQAWQDADDELEPCASPVEHKGKLTCS